MRGLVRVLLIVGAVGIAFFLLREGPKDVSLVYDVSGAPAPSALEVEIRRGGDVLRRAEFRLGGAGLQIRHDVRLPTGDYLLAWRLATPTGTREGDRPLEIRESGPIVLPLGR